MPRTVALFPQDMNERVKEAACSEAITPGHLVDFTTAGLLRKHTTAGVNAVPRFALEQDYAGDTIDTAYAVNEQAKYIVGQPGDEFYAWIPAGAAAIVIGDFLESAGSGNLRKHTPPANLSAAAPQYKAIVGRALEAKDNSAGGTAVRLLVEVV
jgi:hypothetical protein